MNTVEDLRLICAWAAGEHGVTTAAGVLDLVEEPRPVEVEEAWTRVMELRVDTFAGETAERYSAPHVAAELIRSVDDRDMDILVRRLFATDRPATLEDLAQRHGITRERVRQVETRLKDRLDAPPQLSGQSSGQPGQGTSVAHSLTPRIRGRHPRLVA